MCIRASRKDHQILPIAYRRNGGAAEQLDRHAGLESRKVEFHRLCVAREIDHAKQYLVLPFTHIGEDLAVARFEELDAATAESFVRCV